MAATPSDAELVREAIARLEVMAADLDAFINRRAAELAGLSIERANRVADEQIQKAAMDVERKQALVEELRRRLGPLQRQADEASDARDQLARALGHHPLGHFLPALVAEAVAALAADECDGSDVHVDWRCTPEEWEELRQGLIHCAAHHNMPYIQRLRAEGKLDG